MLNDSNSSGLNGGPIVFVDSVAASPLTDDAIDVVVSRLDVPLDDVRKSAALLSDAEQQRANRFTFNRDRDQFIVARAWLRRLLAARLRVCPESIELGYGEYGKPLLAHRCAEPDLRFNVSHADNVAVYAFARRREIGVDVERIRLVHDADAIAARFFSCHENEAYLALDPRDKPLGFFNCWTRKEAFVKALGEGLYYPLDSFDVSLVPGEPARVLRLESASGDPCDWRIESFSPAPGFVAAVVIESVTAEPVSPVRQVATLQIL
jgi:4'-phosphopantetheinyl transferase